MATLTAPIATADKSADPSRAVVFRGDGEPKTPELMVSRLAEIADGTGIEADNYSLGGVVEEVEKRLAAILGKEAAVFMPTGTLANHLAIRNQCGRGQRAIVQEQSHIYHDIGDCVQQLSGINLIPLAHERPYFTLEEVKAAVETSMSQAGYSLRGRAGNREPSPASAWSDYAIRRNEGDHRVLRGKLHTHAFGRREAVHDERGYRDSTGRILRPVRHRVCFAVQVFRRAVRSDPGGNGGILPRPLP